MLQSTGSWTLAGLLVGILSGELGLPRARIDGLVVTSPPQAPALPASHSSYTLAPYTSRGAGPWSTCVAIGDVTGDGRNDVVVTTTGPDFSPPPAHTVFVFAQQPDGTLADPASYPHGGPAERGGLVLTDLDEDGVLDVVVGMDRGVKVLLADGAGGLWPAVHCAV